MTLDLSADKPSADTLADATAISDAFTKIEAAVNNGAGVELGYQESTAAVNLTTFTNAGLANQLVAAPPVTLDGNTQITVEFYAPYVTPGTNSRVRIWLFSGTGIYRLLGLISGVTYVPGYAKILVTPTAGTYTFSVRADFDVTNAAGIVGAGDPFGIGANTPMYIRVARV